MRNKQILAAVAGLATGAAIAYGWKWRQNYKFNQAVDRLRDEIPADEVGGLDLREHLDDLHAFSHIAGFTCMAPCCYTALSEDEVIAYGFPPDE